MGDDTKVKAWYVEDKYSYERNMTVVFAETRGKAKSAALHTDVCSDSRFMDIIATRCPEADKKYSPGKREMNWNNPKDRLFLINKCGFYCLDASKDYCGPCAFKRRCRFYKEVLKNA